jgi:hypothetical protein
MQLRAVQSRAHDFSNARTDLNSAPRLIRPIDAAFATKVAGQIECEPFLSQKSIAHRCNTHQKTISCILSLDFTLRGVNLKWIPHQRICEQERNRVEITRELLQLLENASARAVATVFTGDKTWFDLSNHQSSTGPGRYSSTDSRTGGNWNMKRDDMVCCNRTGCFDVVIFPPGEYFNCSFFGNTALGKFHDHRAETRPGKKAADTFLHIDNALLRVPTQKFEGLRINGPPHPPASPDLVLCDTRRFDYVKTMPGRFLLR